MSTDIESQLLRSILAGDGRLAIELVEDWAEVHGYERAVVELLEPVLATVGEKWATTEDLSLAQGFIAGKVAEHILEKVAASRTTDRVSAELKGPVVIGNIVDDSHALGRKLVVTFLRIAGWEVHDLGNDVLPREFVDKAVEVGAPIIAASAMMYSTAINIRELRAEIDSRGQTEKTLLAVGGAVFVQRPELVQEVGGDGTARNALQAPQLMDQLLEKITAVGKVSTKGAIS